MDSSWAILEEDMEERQVSREESFGKMQQMYAAMRASMPH